MATSRTGLAALAPTICALAASQSAVDCDERERADLFAKPSRSETKGIAMTASEWLWSLLISFGLLGLMLYRIDKA